MKSHVAVIYQDGLADMLACSLLTTFVCKSVLMDKKLISLLPKAIYLVYFLSKENIANFLAVTTFFNQTFRTKINPAAQKRDFVGL